MGVFDQAAPYASQADPGAVVGRVLAATAAPLRFTEWADTRTLPQPGGTDRTADLIAILDEATGTGPWLTVLEMQTRHDPDKLDVTLEEVARGKYRVLTGLISLQGRCPEPTLDMTLPEGFGTRHTALVWNVEADSADATLAAVEAGQASWGMLLWVPLMAGGDDAVVIGRWKEQVLAIADRRRRSDLGKVALFFAERAGRAVAWVKELEGFDMTESTLLNSWIEEAENRKEIETFRRALIRLLHQRFPNQIAPEVVETINSQPSLSMLKDWFDAAATATSAEEFLAVLRR